jgi:RNA polymerase sigma-70 factor, ECF subfamily
VTHAKWARLAIEETGDLIDRAKAGDPDALEQIVLLHAPRISGLLVRLLGPRQDLEDLVQNVFLELCRSLPKFRGDSKLSTFIGGITVRIARRAMRPVLWWTRRSPLVEEPISEAPSPEQGSIDRERLRRLHAALERIAPKKRIAFILSEIEGMPLDQIAETTGASLDATRARIYHARKELRAKAGRDPYLSELLGGDDESR